jgi:hypothetical protein
MKKIIFLLLVLFSSKAPAQSVGWAHQSNNSQGIYGNKICLDGNGNILLAGNARGAATLCNQSIQPGNFIAKFSTAGQCVWLKNIPGEISDLETDKHGNMYVAATFSGSVSLEQLTLNSRGDKDVYVAKLDAGGHLLWAASGGNKQRDLSAALTVDAGGNVYLSGLFNDTAFFDSLSVIGRTGYNAFFVRYSPDGKATRIHHANTHYGYNDPWLQIFDAFCDSNTVYWISGYVGEIVIDDSSAFNTYYTSVIYASYDTAGNGLKLYNVEYDKGTDITHAFTNAAHRVCWSGSTGSQYGHWESIAIDDSLMNWSGGVSLCHPNWCSTSVRSAGYDETGNLYGICNFTDFDTYDMNNQSNWIPSKGQNDFFLIRFGPDYIYQTRTHWGGRGNDMIYDMAVDHNGDCYIVGSFTDTLALDQFTLQGNDTAHFFLAKIENSNTTPVASSGSAETSLALICPNPANGKFRIISGIAGEKQAKIFNMQGQLVHDLQFSSTETEADLTIQPSGVYFVEIISGDKRETQKVIIE